MASNLKGLNVGITGAFGGIGHEICNALLQEGVANLAVLDLKEDSDIVKKWQINHPKQNVFYVPIDVTERSHVENAFQLVKSKLGKLDIFINCSGILDDMNPELTIRVNLLGVIYTTLTAMDHMGKHKNGNGGLIVNVASVLGLEPCSAFANYAASKHGVIGFTRSLSDEYHFEKTGIRFMCICPGITATNILAKMPFSTTLDYVNELGVKFMEAKKQRADICGKNIVNAMKTAKNGSIWIFDLGTTKEINPTKYWEEQHD